MIYWDDNAIDNSVKYSKEVIDVSFKVKANKLLINNSLILYESLSKIIQWLDCEPLAGIHPLLPPDSKNGWDSPMNNNVEYFYPSNRTRLIIRIPVARSNELFSLENKTINIMNEEVKLYDMKTIKIRSDSNLYSKMIISSVNETENGFLDVTKKYLETIQVQPKKMLCGKLKKVMIFNRDYVVRSLLLADLEINESLIIQENGIGPWRKYGYGIFTPYKSIN